jgi:hypothetical protein
MNLHAARLTVLAVSFAFSLWGAPLFSVGDSTLANAAAAGEAAALEAAAGLKGAEAKIVVVFSARKQMTPALIEGLARVFPKERIYGCEGYSPLSTDTNFADQGHNAQRAVSVLAMAGDVTPVPVSETTKIEGKWLACGKSLGQKLKEHYEPGKGVMLTFGDQHVGANNRDLVNGLREALGDKLPLVGAAAGTSGAKEIVAGRIVTATNVVVLLKGDFHVRSMMRGAGDKKEFLLRTTEAFGAVFDAKQKALLTLVFDCGGRRGVLFDQKRLTEEYGVMKTFAGDSPLFGLYGGGEVGCAKLGATPTGVGYHVSVAALLPGAAPE